MRGLAVGERQVEGNKRSFRHAEVQEIKRRHARANKKQLNENKTNKIKNIKKIV